MGLMERMRRREKAAAEEYAEDLARETQKVKAFRAAEDVVEASKLLMKKAMELREEIEDLSDE